MFRLLLVAIPIAITVYALVDVVNSKRDDVRGIPRWTWAVLIVFTLVIGALLWFIFGRPKKVRKPPTNSQWQPPKSSTPPQGPDDDPDFLRSIKPEEPKE